MTRKSSSRASWAAACLLLLARPAPAQAGDFQGALYRNGKTPAGVQVTLYVPDEKPRVQITDETGAFRFLDLPPGRYDLRVWVTSGPSYILEGVTVGAGEDRPAKLFLFDDKDAYMEFESERERRCPEGCFGLLADRLHPMGHLFGGESGEQGAPTPGVEITLSAPGQEPRVRVTDKQGSYRILNLPPGEYRLLAKMPDGSLYEVPKVLVGAGTYTDVEDLVLFDDLVEYMEFVRRDGCGCVGCAPALSVPLPLPSR